MRRHSLARAILITAFGVCVLHADAVAQGAGSLATTGAGVWWREGTAPAHWSAPLENLTRVIRWHPGARGIEWAELDIEVNDGPLRVHTVLVRFSPLSLAAELVHLTDGSRVRGAWTVDSVDADVLIAVNAGQFQEAGPWGWILRNGREMALPGSGPLATAVAFDSAGNVHWMTDADVNAVRQAAGGPRAMARDSVPPLRSLRVAFQSYPRLLQDGTIPLAIRVGRGVDVTHRDTRLALGQLRDGRLLIALTRFGVRESAVARLPIGLTVPEMAALMGALGASNAVMLDGGLSAQVMVRDGRMAPLTWRGLRKVPVALVFRER